MDGVEQLDAYRTNVLEQWVDEREVKKLWVDVHLWFNLHLYADLNQIGAALRGYSVRESEDDCLLVLRITKGDIPYVVFVGSLTATRCMAKLRRQLRDGSVRLVEDRYA